MVPERFQFLLPTNPLTLYGTNTAIADVAVPELEMAGEVEVKIEHLNLVDGSYFLDVAVHALDGRPYDYQSRLDPFSVRSGLSKVGVARLRNGWRVLPESHEERVAHGRT